MIKLILLLTLASNLYATTFKTQPIEQQIRESDGVFQGNYLRSKTIKLENGTLATQMVFRMSRESGLQSELFGMDEVIVHYPGGKLGDQIVRIDGVPEFVSGENVVMFIKNIDNRYWGMNLGFGSFKVINYGNEVILVNYIYPHHPQIGQIKYHYFEKALKSIKGTSFKTVMSPEYLTAPEHKVADQLVVKRQNRAIASKSEQSDNGEDRPNFTSFWLIALLGLSGGIFRLNRKKMTK